MAASNNSANVWPKTNRPVIAFDAAIWHHLPALHAALARGVHAVPDPKRAGLYEIELEHQWYYISVQKPNASVYVIAARSFAPPNLVIELAPAALAV